MVQFGRTVARLRELDYRVMDYPRLATILESRSGMWQDTFATLLQEEIVHLKITNTFEEDAGVPDEVAELLGDAHAVGGSKRHLLSFVNSEACRKIIKKYHKVLLEEQAAGKDVSRAGKNESLLYRSICELQTLYASTDAPLMSTETAQQSGARATGTVVPLLFFGLFFCCVVAFEPILVTLAAAQSRFSEASVIFLEAGISAAVGLAVAAPRGQVREVLRAYHVALLFPTAVLRALGGMLELVVLRWIDPMTFLVISQLRLVLTAVASWGLLRKYPNAIQIRDCVMISLTCLLYSMLDEADSDEDEAASQNFGIALTVLAVACKVGASVWHEYALKKAGNLSVPVQSACISIGMILPAFAGMRCMVMAGLGEDSAGWGIVVVALSCYILLKNWLGNVVVTYGSSVVKYLIYALALPIAYAAELLLGWRQVAWPTVIVVALICVGVWMFAEDGPHAPTTRSDSEPTPATKLLRRFSTNRARVNQVGRQTAVISPTPIIPETPAWSDPNPDSSNSANNP